MTKERRKVAMEERIKVLGKVLRKGTQRAPDRTATRTWQKVIKKYSLNMEEL